VLTTVKCAAVRLRALVARHSARLISNRPIAMRGRTTYVFETGILEFHSQIIFKDSLHNLFVVTAGVDGPERGAESVGQRGAALLEHDALAVHFGVTLYRRSRNLKTNSRLITCSHSGS
jgi:hypothetical protein